MATSVELYYGAQQSFIGRLEKKTKNHIFSYHHLIRNDSDKGALSCESHLSNWILVFGLRVLQLVGTNTLKRINLKLVI